MTLKTTGTGLKLEDAVVLAPASFTGHPRPILPVSWHPRVFDMVHLLSHPGVRVSVKLDGFVWRDLSKEVREWAAACVGPVSMLKCISKPLEPFTIPNRIFRPSVCGTGGPFAPIPGFYTPAHVGSSQCCSVLADRSKLLDFIKALCYFLLKTC